VTIRAQLPDPSPQAASEPPTLQINFAAPAAAPAADAVRLLDHRTRSRGLPLVGAPPGRYLAAAGDGETVLIPLDRPITHVGRGPLVDVGLRDSRVSRRHATIVQRAGAPRVLDDGSANGTSVNGRRILVADLSDGDVLGLGPALVRYVEISPPVAALGGRESRVASRPDGSALTPLAA
jgi:hypothetical protein